MNRGSATKWIRELRLTSAKFDPAQLRFTANGENFMCPLGVLANFLGPHEWSDGWDGCTKLWRGEQFYLPAGAAKKCKMKMLQHEIAAMFADCVSHKAARRVVAQNYQAM